MKKETAKRLKEKQLDDFQPRWNCRFHPTDYWHEVGCPHKVWGVQDLQKALNAAKKTNTYMNYVAFGIE